MKNSIIPRFPQALLATIGAAGATLALTSSAWARPVYDYENPQLDASHVTQTHGEYQQLHGDISKEAFTAQYQQCLQDMWQGTIHDAQGDNAILNCMATVAGGRPRFFVAGVHENDPTQSTLTEYYLQPDPNSEHGVRIRRSAHDTTTSANGHQERFEVTTIDKVYRINEYDEFGEPDPYYPVMASFEDLPSGKVRALHAYQNLNGRGNYYPIPGSSGCLRMSTGSGHSFLRVSDEISNNFAESLAHFGGNGYGWEEGIPIFYVPLENLQQRQVSFQDAPVLEDAFNTLLSLAEEVQPVDNSADNSVDNTIALLAASQQQLEH